MTMSLRGPLPICVSVVESSRSKTSPVGRSIFRLAWAEWRADFRFWCRRRLPPVRLCPSAYLAPVEGRRGPRHSTEHSPLNLMRRRNRLSSSASRSRRSTRARIGSRIAAHHEQRETCTWGIQGSYVSVLSLRLESWRNTRSLSCFDATGCLNRHADYEALACMRDYDNGSQNQKQESRA